jgi:hypothetical protein
MTAHGPRLHLQQTAIACLAKVTERTLPILFDFVIHFRDTFLLSTHSYGLNKV